MTNVKLKEIVSVLINLAKFTDSKIYWKDISREDMRHGAIHFEDNGVNASIGILEEVITDEFEYALEGAMEAFVVAKEDFKMAKKENDLSAMDIAYDEAKYSSDLIRAIKRYHRKGTKIEDQEIRDNIMKSYYDGYHNSCEAILIDGEIKYFTQCYY